MVNWKCVVGGQICSPNGLWQGSSK